MEKVDQTLEGGDSELSEELELTPSTPPATKPEGEGEGEGGDPLDAIQDPVARAEAKKHRAIARRLEKGDKTPEAAGEKPAEGNKPASSSPDFLTKRDFEHSNEKKAIREATADPEVKAHWSDIIPYYTPRHGRETPEDILEDINDAVTLWRARNPAPVRKDNGVGQLTITPVVPAGGGEGRPKAPTTPATPPNFRTPIQPKDWYPPKAG